MKRDELVQALRGLARRRGVAFKADASKGRGAHVRVQFAYEFAIVPNDPTPISIERILQRLDVDPAALEQD